MGIWKKQVDIYTDLTVVDEFITSSLKSSQRVLNDAVNDLLEAGGKRLRPALVLLAGRFGKYNEEKLIPLAASIEIMHMATLVHDDIIDEAELRRGRPTTQTRWGNDVAVFTGDFLFTRAFAIITQKTSYENMHYLAQTIKSVCEGEIEQFESRYQCKVSLMSYLRRISRKTARLFALSCQVGALESKCKSNMIRHLRAFGHDFGMAFQITDDLLDFSGKQVEVGKPLCSDFVQGIYTLPVIYTLQNPSYVEKIRPFMGNIVLDDNALKEIGRLVEESGGIEYSKKLALRYLIRCHVHLNALPNIPAKDALLELVEELIERKY